MYVGQPVQFTSTSDNSDTFSWDFGDGSHSTESMPFHMYPKPGSYTVTLILSGSGGSSTLTKQLKITGITYSCLNLTSGVLTNFSSFYWNGTDIEDFTPHGTLAVGAETDVVITTRIQIYIAFINSGVTWISDNPFNLVPDKHNQLVVDGTIRFYTQKGALNSKLEELIKNQSMKK
jgi:PKD repeat protein